MSSYLSFYLVPRAHPEEKLLLQSFSRSNEVYQRFSDNLNIAYAGNEEKYTKLTISDVESVIQDIDADITKAETRRTEFLIFCTSCFRLRVYTRFTKHKRLYIVHTGRFN